MWKKIPHIVQINREKEHYNKNWNIDRNVLKKKADDNDYTIVLIVSSCKILLSWNR
jgi:hypothetical protein